MAKIDSDTMMTDNPRLTLDKAEYMLDQALRNLQDVRSELALRHIGSESKTLPYMALVDLEGDDDSLTISRLRRLSTARQMLELAIEDLQEEVGILQQEEEHNHD